MQGEQREGVPTALLRAVCVGQVVGRPGRQGETIRLFVLMLGQWGATGGCGERAAWKGLLARAAREELPLSGRFPNSGQSPVLPPAQRQPCMGTGPGGAAASPDDTLRPCCEGPGSHMEPGREKGQKWQSPERHPKCALPKGFLQPRLGRRGSLGG